jgi:uncharacterized membrane protein YozB (DUF420 family)
MQAVHSSLMVAVLTLALEEAALMAIAQAAPSAAAADRPSTLLPLVVITRVLSSVDHHLVTKIHFVKQKKQKKHHSPVQASSKRWRLMSMDST